MPAAPQSPLVTVLAGPARSGKTRRLVEQYARRAEAGKASRHLLWLAPSSRSAVAVRDELVDCGLAACLAPGVRTFADLAKQIIADSRQKLRLISPAVERELLRRVIAAARAAKK